MRILIAFLLTGLFIIMPNSVMAQGHSLYCGGADSTAATQSCLKRHLDAAQNRLNKNYKKLLLQLEGEKKAELEDLQKTWLAYRDSECMWEVANTENKGLKKINELSCMARLTDDRADILSILNDDKTAVDGAREYGSFPRWMNALAGTDGGVYWNYGDRKRFDLNCDGEDEFIMSGIEVRDYDIEKTEEEGSEPPIVYEQSAVISVTQNPAVGKPVPTLFKFYISREEGDNNLCRSDFDLRFIEGELVNINENETEASETSTDTTEAMCSAALEIKASGCDDLKTIVWSDKDFIIAPEVSEDIEAQE